MHCLGESFAGFCSAFRDVMPKTPLNGLGRFDELHVPDSAGAGLGAPRRHVPCCCCLGMVLLRFVERGNSHVGLSRQFSSFRR